MHMLFILSFAVCVLSSVATLYLMVTGWIERVTRANTAHVTDQQILRVTRGRKSGFRAYGR